MKIRKNKQAGFALAEGVLLIVLVGLLVGVGLYVSGKNKDKGSNSAQNSSQVAPELDAKQVGTTAGIEIINQNDINEELKAAEATAAQEESDAFNDVAATSAVGEGYNVNF